MLRINAALKRRCQKNRCAKLHLRRSSFPSFFLDRPFSESLRGGSVCKNMEPDGVAVNEQGVFSINTGTGCFGVVPCCRCCKVFSPPWKRPALLGADFVDVALLTVVQMDANAVIFSALQHETSVESGPCVPLEPIGNGQLSVSSQTFCIIHRQVNDAAGLIATSTTVGLARKVDTFHPPRCSHSSSPTNTLRGRRRASGTR